ncbi:MAG: helix-turn-helix domain-containing protein [Candidatus Diapherotrites archaeon]|nr:helix-turn-helix domain-containing protein [Candidatus Diapherotrites archaeon]
MEKLDVLIAGEIALSKDPGSTMKKWREIFGVSQTELSEALQVSSSTISDYEGGRRKSPGIGVVSRLVETLIKIDETRGGKIRKQLEKDFKPRENIFDVHEFKKPVNGKDFAKKIDAEIVACPQKLKEKTIYGFTVIDSLKVILDVPVHEYMQMYGKTPERALFFDHVETGRSPMIAVKIARFSIDMKPSIVVLHGLQKVDAIAIKIAEAEKIPLLLINKPMAEAIEALKVFE